MAIWARSRRTSSAIDARDVGFGEQAYALLGQRMEDALKLARQRGRGVIAAITVRLDGSIDPLAHIAAARKAGEAWSTFIQPARADFACAALGVAASVESQGAARFDQAAADCGTLLEAAILDDLFVDPEAPPASGVVWVGGFAFLDQTPAADIWRESPGLGFVLPRYTITRQQRQTAQARLTIACSMEADSDIAIELRAIEQGVEALQLDQDLAARFKPIEGEAKVASVQPPEHFERAVAEASSEIRDGSYEKIVLAREVTLRRDHPIDPVNAVRGLVENFPDCTTFAIGHGETTLIGATPELLIRREGRRASTIALAGSMRRGADPETDALLGKQLLASEKNRLEHDLVVQRIERALGRYSAWIAAGEEPEVIKVKNIQHLATPIRAQLTEPRPVIELASALHPTPAVGGEPWADVRHRIGALEGFDRGWYTGGVGWMDLFEDGEFHVALRSALIEGRQARLFAGCGIVGDSDPAAELAETETKLQALLPVLSQS